MKTIEKIQSSNKVGTSLVHVLRNYEYTVFDATGDNEGKGIKAKDILKTLKNID